LVPEKVRHLTESVDDGLEGRLDLERHGRRTFEGVAILAAQRILAMATTIWHNRATHNQVTDRLPLIRSDLSV
jgi:hypothetical protein